MQETERRKKRMHGASLSFMHLTSGSETIRVFRLDRLMVCFYYATYADGQLQRRTPFVPSHSAVFTQLGVLGEIVPPKPQAKFASINECFLLLDARISELYL